MLGVNFSVLRHLAVVESRTSGRPAVLQEEPNLMLGVSRTSAPETDPEDLWTFSPSNPPDRSLRVVLGSRFS